MRLLVSVLALLFTLSVSLAPAAAQSRRRATSAMKTEPAKVACPSLLGPGVKTGRSFCDVLISREPGQGIVVAIPRHSGTAVLTFDLHNRHTYSEELVKSGRAFSSYLATVSVLGPSGEVLARAGVQSEFRAAADLLDRVSGGAGPGGLKAVAPLGIEPVHVTIPAGVTEVTITGDRLTVERMDGVERFASPGRPVAVVSNVMVQYRPAAARRR